METLEMPPRMWQQVFTTDQFKVSIPLD